MPELLVDTSGWAQLVDRTEKYHSLTTSIYRRARQQRQRLITTNYIIVELVALLSSPLRIPRPEIIKFIEDLRLAPHVEIFHIDASTDEHAWRLLTQRADKDWSLVDCASFVIMEQRGIREALTADHHFEQAGFIRLLKP
jgi:uncharacterized protein